ncbi:MAG: hypothetical protein WBB27_02995, partial [Maribacter sp.]
SMNVIYIEEKAFYALWDRVFKYAQSKLEINAVDKWMDKKEAKRLLRIKSDTTLQKLCDEGNNKVFTARKETHSLRPRFDQRLS